MFTQYQCLYLLPCPDRNHSVKGSTSYLAASAIAAFKRPKPELSGFTGLKHAISLSSLPSSYIEKAQQQNDLIIICLSRSDKAFKIHWKICFNESPRILPSLVCALGPSSIHWSYIFLSWSFIGLFHDTSAAWICPVAPPGMTKGSIFSFVKQLLYTFNKVSSKVVPCK